MSTKRTPIRREFKRQITPKAVKAFQAMQAALSVEAWWQHHDVLHDEMGAKPWDWPCIEDPDDTNPYSVGCSAHSHWIAERERHPERLELYWALKRTAAE